MRHFLIRACLVLACLAPALSACGPTKTPVETSPYFDTFYDVAFVESFAPYAAAASNLVTSDSRYLFQKTLGWFFSDSPTTRYNSYPLESSRVHFAHAAGLTGQGQIIGIIDAGFNPAHPDFASKSIYSAQSSASLSMGDPAEDNHGTQVMGIASSDGSGAMIGIAPEADLILGTFQRRTSPTCAADGSDPFCLVSDKDLMTAATNLAASLGAVAVNNSWAYIGLNANRTDYNYVFSGSDGTAYLQALVNYAADGVVVFAMRNEEDDTNAGIMDGLPLLLPQLEPGWLAVGNAVPTYNDSRVTDAARISSACFESARWCLFADGAWSSSAASGAAADYPDQCAIVGGREYCFGTGASFAAPQVAGALAILAEAFDGFGLTPHQLRDRLLASADNSFIGAFDAILDFGNGVTHGFNAEFGHGFLDIRAALLPIGGATLPTPSGASLPVGRPVVVTGSGFGNALAVALEGREVVVRDGLAAGFRMPAEALTAAARPVPLAQMRAAEVSGADLAPLREAATRDPGAGLLDLYGGQSFQALGDSLTASVLLSSNGGSGGVSFRKTADLGGLEAGWGISLLSDRAGPLSLGGISGPTESAAVSLDLGLAANLAPGIRLSVSGQAGIAQPQAEAQALFHDVSQVAFDSIGASLQMASVGRRGDLLSFNVSVPPAATSGTVRASLPTIMSAGSFGFDDVTLNLAPETRQIDFGVTYQAPIGGGAELFLGAYGSDNMVGGPAASYGGVLAVQFRF